MNQLLLIGIILLFFTVIFCYQSIPLAQKKGVESSSCVEEVCLFHTASRPLMVYPLGLSLVYDIDENVVFVRSNNMLKIPHFLVEGETLWRPAQKDDDNLYIFQLYDTSGCQHVNLKCTLL